MYPQWCRRLLGCPSHSLKIPLSVNPRIFSISLILSMYALPAVAAVPVADNILDFDAKTNEMHEGRWAYGWFNRGSINDPKKQLRLFAQAYPGNRVDSPNWALGAGGVVCFALASDGRAFVDGADVTWIYTVPKELSGLVRITGQAKGGGTSKQLRVYLSKDEFLTGIDRTKWKPLFGGVGEDIDVNIEVRVEAGMVIFFVQNDTGIPVNRLPQKLHVKLSKID